MTVPSFDNVAAFVRAFTRLPGHRPITPDTRLEADLGLTGDDGAALLEQAERHFNVALISLEHGVRETFKLGPNEYLFNAEGFFPPGLSVLIRWVRRQPRPVIRDLTVGALYEALCRAAPLERDSAS